MKSDIDKKTSHNQSMHALQFNLNAESEFMIKTMGMLSYAKCIVCLWGQKQCLHMSILIPSMSNVLC